MNARLAAPLALTAILAIAAVLGQEGERKTCHLVGEVVGKTELQVTVRDDNTGEVVVFHPAWARGDAGQWIPEPTHIEFAASVEKGDRVDISGYFAGEWWYFDEYRKLDNVPEDADMATVLRELGAMREQMSEMQAEMDEIKAMLAQLLEK